MLNVSSDLLTGAEWSAAQVQEQPFAWRRTSKRIGR
jgi:hypothetical protein